MRHRHSVEIDSIHPDRWVVRHLLLEHGIRCGNVTKPLAHSFQRGFEVGPLLAWHSVS